MSLAVTEPKKLQSIWKPPPPPRSRVEGTPLAPVKRKK